MRAGMGRRSDGKGSSAMRGSERWLAASVALGLCLVAATILVQLTLFPRPGTLAHALVLVEGVEVPPGAWTRGFAGGDVGARRLEGGRLAEITAIGTDPASAAAGANAAAQDWIASLDQTGSVEAASLDDAHRQVAEARARVDELATLSPFEAHPLDTPALTALRRAVSAIGAARDQRGGRSFVVVGEDEMSARRQISGEIASIGRRARQDLARALAAEAALSGSGPAAPVVRPRLLAPATASAVSPAPIFFPLAAAAALAGAALAGLAGVLLVGRLRRR